MVLVPNTRRRHRAESLDSRRVLDRPIGRCTPHPGQGTGGVARLTARRRTEDGRRCCPCSCSTRSTS
ncbi:hypothetical protein HF995_06400 [Sanguibacter hominis ATCC BAA-789]|uniref:Uncharacterized protein n=1 Tax=Sanguibacter hominis ATCC BAA-789 TaxID=1312740 RepID=A0A9X5FES0_9MICO|nr:hypothetical protein [Sanguibacter hominis ATCC BAA-789]